jgi:haloalkane dehalogenase
MHYLDAGDGDPVVFVHGVPEWSMTYIEVINRMQYKFRCIVPDHLGFGRSDKPAAADFSSAGHSRRLLQLLTALDLADIHLVTHDFGVPIGIGALVAKPSLFKTLTISNGWLWDLRPSLMAYGLRLLEGRLGRWLYLSAGIELHVMARHLFARRSTYRKWRPVLIESHRSPLDRLANYHLMKEMLRAGDHYDALRRQLQDIDIPAQFVWGSKDRLFSGSYLNKWHKAFPHYTIRKLTEAGHFPHMETPDQYIEALRGILH